jgi:hypothetical protein
MNKLLLSLIIAAAFVLGLHHQTETEAASVAQPTASSDCAPRSATGIGVNRAALVVTFEDGHSQTFCIGFVEDSISGLELLRRSGLPLVTSGNGGLGSAVCSINGEGCSNPGDCFCKCKGGTCAFWAYYHYANGAWQISPLGASGWTVRDGDADGWSWGGGGVNGPDESPDCAQPTLTPSPLPTSTDVAETPTPIPTNTPRPTRTPSPDPSAPPQPPAVAPPPTVDAPTTLVPESEVLAEGAVPLTAIPGAATPSPRITGTPPLLTPSPGAAAARARTSATPTAATGVIRVSPEQGEANARASAGEGGGSPWGLLTFAAVSVVLIGAAAAMFVRRRPHADR